ncbi:hypothetical protein [Nannocystis sp. SCPEA4]|uniref:hypothetical protein n=1 Tax=Nannocystis sp. SCPEA4 TaxID=2996787 RepID=UPI00227092CE|nr:hypothetical protein [Nannocystis sp. SCPEA4]MCY1055411.1 hypothetical protein [Nannocystis sp. SCPEA4]
MRSPSSPTDLPIRRITHLFPFPVAGRDVSAIWNETPDDLQRLGLKDVTGQSGELEVRASFADGPFDPILRVYSARDGGLWLLVYCEEKVTLVELPLKEADYEAGDRVYSRGNPDLPYYLGTVKALCARPILSAHWCAMVDLDEDPNEPSPIPIKDIALVNNFTPRRPARIA